MFGYTEGDVIGSGPFRVLRNLEEGEAVKESKPEEEDEDGIPKKENDASIIAARSADFALIKA